MASNDLGGVWRTVGGRRIFIKDGQDLASAMKESRKFKKYKEGIKKVRDIGSEYGFSSQKLDEAIEKKKKQFAKLFKSKEEESTYFYINKIIENEYIPQEVKDEILKFKVINGSPYSDSFYNSNDIEWNSKPENSIRISDHWNFKSHGEIHCKLKGVNEYTVGWKMAKYQNGEYIILKEFE